MFTEAESQQMRDEWRAEFPLEMAEAQRKGQVTAEAGKAAILRMTLLLDWIESEED